MRWTIMALALVAMASQACGDGVKEQSVTPTSAEVTAAATSSTTQVAATAIPSNTPVTPSEPGTPMATATSGGLASETAAPSVTAASKIPDLVRQRIEKVRLAVASGADPAALSDPLLQVNSSGALKLEFHASTTADPANRADLERLGATIVTSLPAPGMTGPSVYVVWMPYTAVEQAASLSWVAVVRPSEATPPDTGG